MAKSKRPSEAPRPGKPGGSFPLHGKRLKIVGGTAAGDPEAPPVWEDKAEGVIRMLRGAAEANLTRAAIVGADASGTLYVASTAVSAEETMGFFQRGIAMCERQCLEAEEEPDDETDPA